MTGLLAGQLSAVDRRPSLHFTPTSGWVNDPVSLLFNGGRYHLFYQYVPGHTEWQPNCCWGHSSSADLVAWSEHAPALTPGDGDLGCWSGRLIEDDGVPVIYYTSVNHPNVEVGAVREARPLDRGWERWAKGPVVVSPPDDADLVAFRDPSVFRDGSGWRMVVGAGYADGHAAVLSYSSSDRRTWTYDGAAIEQSPEMYDGNGRRFVWECPHVVQVDGRHVLIVSVMIDGHTSHVEAAVGDYRDGRFTPEAWTRLTEGHGLYAASPFTDSGGRAGLMFWVRDVGGAEEGWAGAQSIPYLLAVDEHDVRLRPHPAVKAATPEEAGVVGLDWWPTEEAAGEVAVLELPAESGGCAVRLVARQDSILVEIGGSTVRLTRDAGPVSLLADHHVLEICTGAAVAAFGLAADAGPPQQDKPGSTSAWGPASSGAGVAKA